MKKKNVKKLALNKGAISNLEKVKGGNPKPVSPGPQPVRCSWDNPCSVKPSCWISFYASDCWWI